MILKKRLRNLPVVVDQDHDFMPVICENKKQNGHFCNTWLGEIETSRPTIAKFHCRDCKRTYRYEVHGSGRVEWATVADEVVSTKIPVKATVCSHRM